MILAIDVGNSNIEGGIFEAEEGSFSPLTTFRLSTDKTATTDEFGIRFKNLLIHNNIEPANIKSGIYSSVVPNVNHSISKMLYKYFGCNPIQIKAQHFSSMPVHYDDMSSLGTDRLVNAYYTLKNYGAPAVIVDFGTATTFCAVSAKGEYIGGLIMPGISISLLALVERTSKLPKVELAYPERVIERNTSDGMKSGIYHQTVCAVDGIVRKMKAELKSADKCRVIATGGLSGYISQGSEEIEEVDELLSLKGIKLIHDELG